MGLCALVVAVACVGKFGGSYGAARLTGLDRRAAASLGVLMVVLNIGLDLGVISAPLFAVMVVTTLATTPLVRRLAPPG